MVIFVPLFALILFINTSSFACEPYDRKAWKHWVDEDRDCQNARHEALIEESLTPVTFKTDKGLSSDFRKLGRFLLRQTRIIKLARLLSELDYGSGSFTSVSPRSAKGL
jgi:hypothetical protein